jgi:hypothetical protein
MESGDAKVWQREPTTRLLLGLKADILVEIGQIELNRNDDSGRETRVAREEISCADRSPHGGARQEFG